MININVCKEFSEFPSGRTRSEGKYSGEAFREELLLPRYDEAVQKNEQLYIDFDGGFGYGPSFLEEAFGGLVRSGRIGVWPRLLIKSYDDETVSKRIEKYITDAEEALSK